MCFVCNFIQEIFVKLLTNSNESNTAILKIYDIIIYDFFLISAYVNDKNAVQI